MSTASQLQPEREYLLWWENHRDRWVAAPVVRAGGILADIDYHRAVTVHPAHDDGGSCAGTTS